MNNLNPLYLEERLRIKKGLPDRILKKKLAKVRNKTAKLYDSGEGKEADKIWQQFHRECVKRGALTKSEVSNGLRNFKNWEV